MRTLVIAAMVVVLTAVVPGGVSAQNGSKSILERLAGVWTAEPFTIPLTTDLDVSVWGPNASSVRKVELTLRPSGEGDIKVTRSVVDAQGRTKRASVSIEQAQLLVRAPETGAEPKGESNRIEPTVEVRNPERRYPDDPKDTWPLTGLVVKLIATDADPNRLYIRFDLPDGRGSFGETLTRRPAVRRGKRDS